MKDTIEAYQTYRFTPVGECIYCGEKDDLTDEHIIPLALGGNLVLPDASCKDCAKVTSRFERRVLRGFMYDARVAGDFPSRRKKKRPHMLPTKLVSHENKIIEHDIATVEAAGLLSLPILRRASILTNHPPAQGVHITGAELLNFGKNVEEIIHSRNAKGIEFGTQVQATAFSQLLAKIAYGYLVATIGLFSRNETPLLRLIMGKTDDSSSWVGSHDYKLNIESKNPLHAMKVVPCSNAEKVQGFIVYVKLFSNVGATGYEIATKVPGWQQYTAQQ